MSESEVAALKLAVEAHRSWANVCAAGLIAGLFGEVWVSVWFRERRSPWEMRLTIAFAALVAVAVLGEVLFGNWADDAADALQENADRTVATLNLETEKLRRSNLELEEMVQVRRLTPENHVDFATVIGALPTSPFRLLIAGNDMEAMLFAIQLRTLLRDDVGWQGGSIFRDSRLAAIGVHVAFNVSSEVGAANASHINALLNQAGFMSMLAYGEPDHDGLPTVWDDSIEIRVGAKPLPYMPELGDLCPRPCQ